MKDNIKPGKFLYVISTVIFVIGFVVFSSLLLGGISSFADKMGEQIVVPGTKVIELKETGKYTIYFEHRTTIDGKVFDTKSIDGLKCNIKNVNTNENVTLKSAVIHSQYSFGDREGYSVFEFNINQPGKYELSAAYESGSGEEAVLTVGQGFGMKLAVAIIRSIGILFIFIGVSLAIFLYTLLKRVRAKRAQMM